MNWRGKTVVLFGFLFGAAFAIPSFVQAAEPTVDVISSKYVSSDGAVFSIAVSTSDLEPNTEYRILSWVYGGSSAISQFWTGSSWVSSYEYDYSFTTDDSGAWTGALFLKIVKAPKDDYNYYLKVNIRKPDSSSDVATVQIRKSSENFIILDDLSASQIKGSLDESIGFSGDPAGLMILARGLTDNVILAMKFFDPTVSQKCNPSAVFFNLAVPPSQTLKLEIYTLIDLLNNNAPTWQSADSYTFTPNQTTNLNSNSPPHANFELDKSIFTAGEIIEFSGLDSSDIDCDPLLYSWGIDDEEPVDEAEIDKSFTNEGSHSVTLKVCDFELCDTSEKLITVINPYDKVILSEIAAKNADGKQWIELRNISDFDIPLDDWEISDKAKRKKKLDGFVIRARQFLIITDLTFLNTSTDEEVYLKYPSGEIADKTNYHDEFELGLSWAKAADSSWSWTETPTPALANIITATVEITDDETDETINEVASVALAKTMLDQRVKIQVVVTAGPKILAKQYFYGQDDSGGIQIYNYWSDFPADLTEGMEITVDGTITETSGEKRLKMDRASSITIVSTQEPIEAEPIEIADLDQDRVGTYIEIKGWISETSGDIFVVSDIDGNEIKVIIRATTNIDKPKMRKGDPFVVAGVLSSYKDELRILPFHSNDVRPATTAELPRAGPGDLLWLYFGLPSLASYVVFKKRQPVSTSGCFLLK